MTIIGITLSRTSPTSNRWEGERDGCNGTFTVYFECDPATNEVTAGLSHICIPGQEVSQSWDGSRPFDKTFSPFSTQDEWESCGDCCNARSDDITVQVYE